MTQVDRYNCEETFRRLDDYLDRELTLEEMQRVREHLDVCAVCASEYAFEGTLLREIRSRLERIDAPSDLLARIRGALDRVQTDLTGADNPG